MKLWDIVPNKIRVTNLYLTKNMTFCCFVSGALLNSMSSAIHGRKRTQFR